MSYLTTRVAPLIQGLGVPADPVQTLGSVTILGIPEGSGLHSFPSRSDAPLLASGTDMILTADVCAIGINNGIEGVKGCINL